MNDNVLNMTHTYNDVESGMISYEQFIISSALDIIARDKKVDRCDIYQWLIHTYGGTVDIAIIDYFRNRY